MNVLVDTSVWSLALRRAKRVADSAPRELVELVKEGRVVMLGAVRQELLSGIREKAQFELLKERLRAFPDAALDEEDYERAAEMFNQCRERGIRGSNTDFLLCAVAQRRQLSIFTRDNDFRSYGKVLKFALHEERG